MGRWLIWGIIVSIVVGFRVQGIVLLVIMTWFQRIVMFVVLVVSEGVVDVLHRVLWMPQSDKIQSSHCWLGRK